MEGAQVFTCNTGGNVRSLFSKNNNNDALFLKVENDKVSGKGYVCNEDGRNGYVDEFEFAIKEVKSVFLGEYMGMQALGFNAKVNGLYGAKKAQIMLPQLKNMDLVVGLLNRLKASAESNAEEEARSATVRRTATPPPAPTPAPAPREQTAGYQHSAPEPVSRPASTSAAPRPSSSYSSPAPEPAPAPVPAAKSGLESDEFQQKMDKLVVLKDCGLLGEKEFKAKKAELVGQYCDLSDFNEKIQKLIVLKDCGLLSEKEFEANRNDIIKECCDTGTSDPTEYMKSVQKLSFLEMGGVITTEEYEKNKQTLIDDVTFMPSDDRDTFLKKLRRLPVLKQAQLITGAEYDQRLNDMYGMIEINADDETDVLAVKMSKWSMLAQERIISANDLKEKQKTLIAEGLNGSVSSPEELKATVKRLVALRDGEWLSDRDYEVKKEELLRKINTGSDYSETLKMYRMLAEIGFVSDQDYRNQRQKCIDDIFKPYGSMDEFKVRVNNLLELQKAGIITEEEFASFKTKLMSEL
ncbi:MAG: hypothetical protein NC126_02180 [Clostridium sp.]|nr:hypothetical protein [Clostridium sp.]